MKKFEKEYRKLVKLYNKKLNTLHRANKYKLTSNLDYFVISLQYLRDYFILTENLAIDGKENIKIATIATAISEYQQYYSCIHKYFDFNGKCFIPKEADKKDELIELFGKEKQFHWNNFWAIVKDNLELWGIIDGTI